MRIQLMLVAGLSVLLSPAAFTASENGTLVPPEDRLNLDQLEMGWADLFGKLRAVGAIRASFVEERYFKFRREPKVYCGEFRRSPEGAVSLAYTGGEEAMALHVGPDYAYYRDETAEVKAIPARSSRREALLLFPRLVGMQTEALGEVYDFYGRFEGGGAWILELRQKAGDGPESEYEAIFLRGNGATVRAIILKQNERERVEIRLEAIEHPEDFDATERERFFFKP